MVPLHGAGSFCNAAKRTKNAARLASRGSARSRQICIEMIPQQPRIRRFGVRKRGRAPLSSPPKPRCWNCGISGKQILPPLTGARVGPQGELTACGRLPRTLCPAAFKRRRKKTPRSFRNIRCRRLGAWRSLKSSLFKQIPRPIAPYRRPVAKHPIFFRRERCRLQSARRDAFLVLFAALQKEPAPEAEQSF